MKKKKVWLILFLTLTILIVSLVIVANKKPTDADFVRWMEDRYAIECWDYNCSTFEIVSKDDDEDPIIMSADGAYSPGLFIMEVIYNYRSNEEPSYDLDLHVRGFFGNFKVLEEKINKIPKR